MQKALSIALIAACCLAGCSKSKSGAAASAAAASDDPVQKRLQELVGSGAKNCGLVQSQTGPQTETASKCAMDSAKAKSPFYVEYQMPGMNVAIAGDSQGKLYSVQSQTGGAGLTSADCPAELRVAPSGRVTCYAPGTFPMGAGAGSHSGMSMPSGMGGALPPGHPKPQSGAKPQAKP